MEAKSPNDQISLDLYGFNVGQIKEFLSATSRSDKCPVCPHEGNWLFHVESRDLKDDDNGILMIVPHPLRSDDHIALPSFVLECPKCAYLVFTSLLGVKKYFDEKDAQHG